VGHALEPRFVAHQVECICFAQLGHSEVINAGWPLTGLARGEQKLAGTGQAQQGGEQALDICHRFEVVHHDQVGSLAQAVFQRQQRTVWSDRRAPGCAGYELRYQCLNQGLDGQRGCVGRPDPAGCLQEPLLCADPAEIGEGLFVLRQVAYELVRQRGLADPPDPLDGDQFGSVWRQQHAVQSRKLRFHPKQSVIGAR